jgi:REP element-mobilizing transposase RayT
MARRLRIQYPGAIYHVMSRGNARQKIVRDDLDCERLLVCLKRSVERYGWRVYAFVVMSNHLHLVLETPRPNLAAGMQVFLSSYANGWSRWHRVMGHVFQGRYRTELATLGATHPKRGQAWTNRPFAVFVQTSGQHSRRWHESAGNIVIVG